MRLQNNFSPIMQYSIVQKRVVRLIESSLQGRAFIVKLQHNSIRTTLPRRLNIMETWLYLRTSLLHYYVLLFMFIVTFYYFTFRYVKVRQCMNVAWMKMAFLPSPYTFFVHFKPSLSNVHQTILLVFQLQMLTK